MSDSRDFPGDEPQGPLEFDRAEFDSSESPACAACSAALRGSYYTLGDRMLCEPCHFEVRDAGPSGSVATRALGAIALGAAAAVVGGAVWMLVTEITGYEIGLIAIAVGFLVGAAVRLGSRQAGGVGYQLIAVFLTYTAVVMTYVPAIVAELRANDGIQAQLEASATDPNLVEIAPDGTVGPAIDEDAITRTLYLIAIPIAFAAPFLLGFENIIGIVIIAFALYQAWKMNARVYFDLKGPFRLGTGDAPLA